MLSLIQCVTLEQIRELENEFGNGKWFVLAELPGITIRTMDVLVQKGFLDAKVFSNGCKYYRMKNVEAGQ